MSERANVSTFSSPTADNAAETPIGEQVRLTEVMEWSDGALLPHQDTLAVEEPLEIRIGDTPISVTMRTPGHDLELAAGFLLTEDIVEKQSEIVSLRSISTSPGKKQNGVVVTLQEGNFDVSGLQRNFFAASSCGICGKASIEAIRNRGLRAPNLQFRFDPEMLCTLPETLGKAQPVFGQTGGLHAAALFDGTGQLLVIREDIGRHNAVDKVIGWALLKGLLPLSEHILLVSGRGGFEIAQKALAAGVPVLASISAPSSLAVQLSRELGLTLIGFLRGRRFVLYAGASRCEYSSKMYRNGQPTHAGESTIDKLS
jgi:FdhD protein